jgi:hypothetical protein
MASSFVLAYAVLIPALLSVSPSMLAAQSSNKHLVEM